jgi:hypothetical protein
VVEQTIQDALAKHQAEHGCVLPMNRVATPQETVQVHALMAPQQTSDTTGATLPGTLPGFFPFPLTVPSSQQNSTTQTPGRHMRHPTNQIKPLLITTQLAEAKVTIDEDFNLPDSATSCGPDWIQRNGTVGILNNAAYPLNQGAWQEVTHKTIMPSDDMEAAITLGPMIGGTADHVLVFVGSDDAGQNIFAYLLQQNYSIWYQNQWDQYTVQYSGTLAYTEGDELKLRRLGNTYYILHNDVDIGITWQDTGGLVPIDADHRQVGFGVFSAAAGEYRTVEHFNAKEL